MVKIKLIHNMTPAFLSSFAVTAVQNANLSDCVFLESLQFFTIAPARFPCFSKLISKTFNNSLTFLAKIQGQFNLCKKSTGKTVYGLITKDIDPINGLKPLKICFSSGIYNSEN